MSGSHVWVPPRPGAHWKVGASPEANKLVLYGSYHVLVVREWPGIQCYVKTPGSVAKWGNGPAAFRGTRPGADKFNLRRLSRWARFMRVGPGMPSARTVASFMFLDGIPYELLVLLRRYRHQYGVLSVAAKMFRQEGSSGLQRVCERIEGQPGTAFVLGNLGCLGAFVEKRSHILERAGRLLHENARYINKKVFGDPSPALAAVLNALPAGGLSVERVMVVVRLMSDAKTRKTLCHVGAGVNPSVLWVLSQPLLRDRVRFSLYEELAHLARQSRRCRELPWVAGLFSIALARISREGRALPMFSSIGQVAELANQPGVGVPSSTSLPNLPDRPTTVTGLGTILPLPGSASKWWGNVISPNCLARGYGVTIEERGGRCYGVISSQDEGQNYGTMSLGKTGNKGYRITALEGPGHTDPTPAALELVKKWLELWQERFRRDEVAEAGDDSGGDTRLPPQLPTDREYEDEDEDVPF
jgi:hypothetical protein